MLRLVLPLILGLVVGSACTAESDPSSSTPEPDTATGSGPSPLPARWWLWTNEFAPGDNPIEDATGARCGLHQPDDVWFLAGTYGGPARRSCTVPAGRPVYFPVLNTICSVPAGVLAERAIEECSSEADQLEASLDGTVLPIEEADSEEIFTFTARDGSATGLPAGQVDAVVHGYWVGPLDLNPGVHVLEFSGSSGTFSLDVRYRLTSE